MFYLVHIFKRHAVFVAIMGSFVLWNAWDFGPWVFGLFCAFFAAATIAADIRQRRIR